MLSLWDEFNFVAIATVLNDAYLIFLWFCDRWIEGQVIDSENMYIIIICYAGINGRKLKLFCC